MNIVRQKINDLNGSQETTIHKRRSHEDYAERSSVDLWKNFSNETKNSINSIRTCPCGEVVHERCEKSGRTARNAKAGATRASPIFFVRGDFFWSSFVWQTKEDKIQSKAQD